MINNRGNGREGSLKSCLPERSINGRDGELLEMLSRLRELPDEAFWMESFARSSLCRLWSVEKKLELGKRASDCGKEYAAKYAAYLGEGGVRQLCLDSGIRLGGFDMPVAAGIEVFALFETPNTITVRSDLLKNFDAYAADTGIHDTIGGFVCEEVILAHEFFHFIEHRDEKTIFTCTYSEPVGLFKIRRVIPPLGEIAAMSFAKQLMKLEWNPFLLDCVMMSMNNMQGAKAIASRLLSLAETETGQ